MPVAVPSWEGKQRADEYKASVVASIPPAWLLPSNLAVPNDVSKLAVTSGILSKTEAGILAHDATALRDAIAGRTYTAVQVTMAYCKAAAIVHQATNCLMDYFSEEAIDRAKWLDEELERTGQPVGPLHGVPISVKGLKGHEISAGFLSMIGNAVPAKDASIIAILRAAGAVFYVKTTNPQGIMHLETDNFLGPTVNPYNRRLTPGGSSGGESALIGGGGSVLGIGTDIGGSIRNPAAHCGLFGFKPTSIRLPKFGNVSVMVGQESIAGAIGPMGRSARDLELFIETVLAAQPWRYDPSQVGMPWRPAEVSWKGGAKPRVGVMWDDGVVEPQPTMQRAMKTAVDKLVAAGFEIKDYTAYNQAEGWEIISSLYFTDGGERFKKACQATGEPLLPLTEFILSQKTQARTSSEVFELVKRRERFRAEYAAHFMAADVDVILCPPAPGAAPALGTSRYWSYTSMFNLVDYPSGVFPTGLSVELSDVKKDRTDFLSAQDQEVWEAYDPEVMVGAPLSLQVAAPRWEDEKAFKALEIISQVVRA